MLLQKQIMYFHYSVDTLVIDPRLTLLPQSTIQYRCDTTVSIDRPLVRNLPDQSEVVLITGFSVDTLAHGFSHLRVLVRPGDFQDVCREAATRVFFHGRSEPHP